jgi:acetoin utilization protein AcuC
MSRSVRVVWDEALATYDFGLGHPLAPLRVDLAIRLARAFGLLDLPNVTVGDAPVAGDDLLRLVHDQDYIGLGTEDNPVFAGMHEASAHVVGATVAAADAVASGAAEHAVNISGGLHHAMAGAASGFCIYNDPAIGIARLLDHGVERVGYVDVDVHHGDGVQQAFWDDPRVLTISLHETGRALFPGTGFPDESGGPKAEGYAVNVALPPGLGDNGWLRAFHAVVPHLLEAFQPQVLVTQHGCDSHFLDPLAHLTLSVDGQRMAYEALHRLAHRHAGGRWLVTGGGGYEIVEVVPRAWTHLIAEVAGEPVDPQAETPLEWQEHVKLRTGRTAPFRMTDGREPVVRDWTSGYDPADWVDRSIMATRTAVFPAHGLDVMVDL